MPLSNPASDASSRPSRTEHLLYVCLPIAKSASRFTPAAFDSDDLARLDVRRYVGIQIRDPQSGEPRTSRPWLRSKADCSQVPRSQHPGGLTFVLGEVVAQSF